MPPGIGYPPFTEPPPEARPLPRPLPLPLTPMPAPAQPQPAPAMPAQPPSSRFSPDAIAGLVALASSLIGGPRTTGLASGMAQGLRQNEAQAFRQQQFAAQEAERQAILAEREAARQEARQRQLQAVLLDVSEKVPQFSDKAAYDRYINFVEQTLAQSGYNIPPNSLRAQLPFVAPTAQKRAEKAVNDILKNPLSKDAIDLAHRVAFDRDGDGAPELVPFGELVDIAGMNVFRDETGKPILGPKGPPEVGDKFKELLGAKLERFRAEKGREPDPSEREALIKAAVKEGAEAQRIVVNTGAPGALPTATQRRVDAAATAFNQEPAVKRTNIQAEAYSFVKSLSDTTTSPADDQALIYAFAKAMDPESVVREGEYATVQKYAQSWLELFGFNARRVIENSEFLTPESRRNMKNTIRKRYLAGKQQYDNLRRQYGTRINRLTGQQDGESYLIDYAGAFPDTGQAASADAAPPGVRKLQDR